VLPTYSIDVFAAHNGERSMTEQVNHIQAAELAPLTGDIFDRIGSLLSGVNDVIYIPSQAEEDGSDKWNLAHVVAHLTASIEERACLGSILARGCEAGGQVRAETDWEMIVSRDQLDQRLAESRRMAMGYLTTWPDEPNLTNEYQHGWLGPMNAIACHLSGLNHALGHLEQIEELAR
jgi:hypothetical protein